MEARSDAHGLRRLRVVLVVECPRLAHDRVSGDPHGDVRDATLSGDCLNTFKIFRTTKLADFVNRPPLGKPSPRRNRYDRSTAFGRCRTVFNRHAQAVTLICRNAVGRAVSGAFKAPCQLGLQLQVRVVQPLEGSS